MAFLTASASQRYAVEEVVLLLHFVSQMKKKTAAGAYDNKVYTGALCLTQMWKQLRQSFVVISDIWEESAV